MSPFGNQELLKVCQKQQLILSHYVNYTIHGEGEKCLLKELNVRYISNILLPDYMRYFIKIVK